MLAFEQLYIFVGFVDLLSAIELFLPFHICLDQEIAVRAHSNFAFYRIDACCSVIIFQYYSVAEDPAKTLLLVLCLDLVPQICHHIFYLSLSLQLLVFCFLCRLSCPLLS